jgi:hypothetical protein
LPGGGWRRERSPLLNLGKSVIDFRVEVGIPCW